jgi:hypothetical protein
MSRVWTLIVALSSLCVVACASTYRVVQIPQREADMYPLSQTKGGITIAIDEIRSAARAQRYFGANIVPAGVLPVVVVVSNHSSQNIVVKPADVLLQRGRDIVDPLPLESVVAVATGDRWFLRKKTVEQVEGFLSSVAFKETVLLPNDSYQGVMFFANARPRRQEDRFFTISSLFADRGPRIRVAITDLEEPRRVHFGPFSLSSQEQEIVRARFDMLDRF